jgi:hypothetical protein
MPMGENHFFGTLVLKGENTCIMQINRLYTALEGNKCNTLINGNWSLQLNCMHMYKRGKIIMNRKYLSTQVILNSKNLSKLLHALQHRRVFIASSDIFLVVFYCDP